MCPAQIAPEWGRVGAADLAGASSAAWAVWHALSKKRRFFIPAEGFFGKIFAFGDQFRRLVARLFGSELRAPSSELRSERDASEISPTRFSRGRWWMRLPTRRCPSQTSSFGSMRTSTGCGGNGGGKTVLPFILSPVPHSRYAAVIAQPTRNIPSTPEIFWPPKTADPPNF